MALCFSDDEAAGTDTKEESPNVVMRPPKATKRRKEQELPANIKRAKTGDQELPAEKKKAKTGQKLPAKKTTAKTGAPSISPKLYF